MEKQIIAILGGNKKNTFLAIGQRHGVEVLFFKPFKKCAIKRALVKIIKHAHSVVIIGGCCSHKDMLEAKKIAKMYHKPFIVESSQGATNAIRKGMMLLENV